MARSYANIVCTIWDDDEFCALSAGAKSAYFMLVTQSDITACGALPLTLRRWSQMVAQGERDDLVTWLEELAEARFVLIDDDTEEVVVRTFAKWDGGYKHPSRRQAVVATAQAVRSKHLRYSLATELARLGVETGIEVPSDWDPTATRQAVSSHMSVDSRYVTTGGTTLHTPEPHSTLRVADAPRADVEALCDHLADRIERNGAKRPPITDRWRTACRLMLDVDRRTTDQVRAAIDWCQNDEFWRANVLSMPKLRERYDQLSLQAQRQRPPSGGRRSTTEDRVTTALDIHAQLAAEGR